VTIYVPRPLTSESPRFACTICEAIFTADERHAFERHVLSHPPEEIKPHSPHMSAPGLFDPNADVGDTDWRDWIDKNNRERPEAWRKWMKTDLDKG
jgi:hypothetical protein